MPSTSFESPLLATMTSPQVAAPALPPRHRTPSPQPPLDAASSPQTTAPVATTGLAPAAAASPSKISSLKQVAAAKQLATKMSDRAIAAANDMNLHVPTVKEVLAFSPVKHAYKTLKPFIVNEDGRLGEDTPEAKRRSLERIQFVSTWLDAKYKVPFTKYKIGVGKYQRPNVVIASDSEGTSGAASIPQTQSSARSRWSATSSRPRSPATSSTSRDASTSPGS
ncbi:uncharacterized protein EV422DRAFT_906 [Fimicolochytrium jonesii]|uniref:uncharacterized protein n=1 Tax=Fimicolochytrium jonesii TaxID=1396493 RepID=UPI0022FDE333|nr:uncharacterized protein EV422DRAFT_906 [Fimicolochytrium jonesii]KAI8826547.1 hypothetical protein EV422DRAFT_906 [Fimicolochytrium jonesii]